MAQLPSGGFQQQRAKTGHDIFTALVILAFVFVFGTIVFVVYRSNDLFGQHFPGFAG